MKSSSTKKVNIHLVLDENEARILKTLVQNSSSSDPEEFIEFKENMFRHLKKRLEE